MDRYKFEDFGGNLIEGNTLERKVRDTLDSAVRTATAEITEQGKGQGEGVGKIDVILYSEDREVLLGIECKMADRLYRRNPFDDEYVAINKSAMDRYYHIAERRIFPIYIVCEQNWEEEDRKPKHRYYFADYWKVTRSGHLDQPTKYKTDTIQNFDARDWNKAETIEEVVDHILSECPDINT